jgi:NAD-dependent dihydropyrimidine dehydrogenase PreA subunit
MAAVPLEIDLELCDGCGKCLPACEPQALAMVDGVAVLAWPDRCVYDGGCEPACPVGAIRLPYMVVFSET